MVGLQMFQLHLMEVDLVEMLLRGLSGNKDSQQTKKSDNLGLFVHFLRDL